MEETASTASTGPPATVTFRAGQAVEVLITDLAFGGRGVGRVGGFVVFVEGALPGETVRARVRRVRRGYAEAECDAVLRPSPARAAPPCGHYGACGGCDLQHLAATAQARAKRDQVAALVERIAGQPGSVVRDLVIAGEPGGYRFRMDFAWGRDASGGTVLGLHRRGRPHRIVRIDRCHILPEEGNAILGWLAAEAASRRLVTRDARGGSPGLLRRAGLQIASGTGEILLTLETGRGDPPALAEFARDLVRRYPRIVGVVRHEFDRRGEPAGVSILTGRDHLFERVEEDRLKVPASAFFQANRFGFARLRREAIEALAPIAGEALLEIYSGVGFFTLPLARRCAEVVAIEGWREAVAAARDNAARAGVSNIRFVGGDVAEVLPEILAGGRFDAALVDPPRAGLAPPVAGALAGAPLRRLVYVSCDPATLARDLKVLIGGGFELEAVVPVDLFPHTHHIECVARLRRMREPVGTCS
jgi:23S rRNA (uracil1939-C5)-methyltransferase